MKKQLKNIRMITTVIMCSCLLTSCFTYTTIVGKGATGNNEIKKWNNYLFWGLAPIGLSDAKVMAGGATDYSVTTQETFVNGLLRGLTFGIYCPTTTIVTK